MHHFPCLCFVAKRKCPRYSLSLPLSLSLEYISLCQPLSDIENLYFIDFFIF